MTTKSKSNSKRKSGPVGEATKMLGGVAKLITKPVTKAGAKADKAFGKLIGHNPVVRFASGDREKDKKAADQYKRLMEYDGREARVERSWGEGYQVVVNPCKKGGRKRNPESEAAEMFESFSGKKSESVDEFEETEAYHSWLAKGGDLLGLKVRTLSGYDATIIFKGVVMGLNEKGTSIHPVGGEQSLDLKKLHMEDLENKDSIVVGWIWAINYEAEKDFDGYEKVSYIHTFGPEKYHEKMYKDEDLWDDAKPPREEAFESGELPMLRYDLLNSKVTIEGGTYKIDKPWLETSPGIEG